MLNQERNILPLNYGKEWLNTLQKSDSRKSIRIHLIVILALSLFGGLLYLLSPRFNMTYITISGLHDISRDEILIPAGLDSPTNIFIFSPRRARRAVMENLFIDEVSFTRTLPNSLHISIRERHHVSYVEFLGRYLFLDENGRVLHIGPRFGDVARPVITGFDFTAVRLGEILETDNHGAFATILIYSRLLRQQGLLDIVTRMDVSDHRNTRLRIHNFEVSLGTTHQAPEKIMLLVEILAELPEKEQITGFLDLREISGQYVFQLLR